MTDWEKPVSQRWEGWRKMSELTLGYHDFVDVTEAYEDALSKRLKEAEKNLIKLQIFGQSRGKVFDERLVNVLLTARGYYGGDLSVMAGYVEGLGVLLQSPKGWGQVTGKELYAIFKASRFFDLEVCLSITISKRFQEELFLNSHTFACSRPTSSFEQLQAYHQQAVAADVKKKGAVR